jgi:virulence-associated protein VagC
MEADNDDIDIDVSDSVTINDETAIDEAGEDSETVDVSNISESQAAHNEAASAGGIATGNNTDQIEMDPVAAEEAYIMRHFGLSREDLEEAVDETVQEAAAIPNAEVEDEDDELEATSAGTTVNISSPVDTHVDINAADEVEVDTDAEEVDNSDTPAIETAADIATLEGLRRLWSTEDDDPEGTSSDVEFDVRTPENDVNIELEGRAVTIEPNEGGDDDYSADDSGSDDYSSDDESESDDVEGPEAAEEDASPEGDEGSDEETSESLLYWL